MNKLSNQQMKKIMGGGEDEVQCLKACNLSYNYCISLAPAAYCQGNRDACRLNCLGCDPICP